MKICPGCKREIGSDMIVCEYCDAVVEMVSDETYPAQQPKNIDLLSGSRRKPNGCLRKLTLSVAVLSAVFVALYFVYIQPAIERATIYGRMYSLGNAAALYLKDYDVLPPTPVKGEPLNELSVGFESEAKFAIFLEHVRWNAAYQHKEGPGEGEDSDWLCCYDIPAKDGSYVCGSLYGEPIIKHQKPKW